MTAESQNALFQQAIAAIDAGDAERLTRLLDEHPDLAGERLEHPGDWLRDRVGAALDGFFSRPYLLWFLAEDPVRAGVLPPNAAQLARVVIDAARRHRPETLQAQLDEGLPLVCWSWIARQCGVQVALIDVLLDAGAKAQGNPENALVNGNVEAARHLIGRGAPFSLGAALCLERWEDADRLAASAEPEDLQFALVLTALRGQAEGVRRAIRFGADPDQRCPDLYGHASPLHHAVSSGSIEAVRVLVESGADLTPRDTAWQATPLGWAEYYPRENPGDERSGRYLAIARYLEKKGAPR